ncbi:MAG: carboxylate-amine ligase [Chloroflexi bacterium]|nr:carboxylate-amine ligase [Chloroflexota bacterium]MXY00487.1 carboxylate-amine ligase [Chloroflexota bacterium]
MLRAAGGCALDELKISLGVEEEFFLVDPESRDLLADPDVRIFEACEANRGPHKIVREFLRAQIETNSRVCATVEDTRTALVETRRIVIEAAEAHGAAVMAASTHPFADWREQAPTPRERYERFTITYQESVRRFLIGGMHIHAGFGDSDSRIRIMTAMRRYLPILHALSATSPFIEGHETGFKSYRLNLLGNLPRTSMPGPLRSRAEYDRLVADYRRMDFISDGSELWWDIRPSHAFPTIEMRICDICTRLEDAMCMVAMYASLIRWLLRQDQAGALPPEPPTEIIAENRWLAQRYGVLAFFGDEGGGGRKDILECVQELVDMLADDARELGCEAEVRHALEIIREGTGADRQVDLYRLRRLEGDSHETALLRVVDLVLDETRASVNV